ncbi:N-acetyl-6-hydroxytryptophan oxidase ivoB [Fusarium oxysporum f. sp. albedinis]|nr:N-acetyl-6-hydroxytryptophan oxidase ivoB [Fusarium oxysporum f. sp. albedinis]
MNIRMLIYLAFLSLSVDPSLPTRSVSQHHDKSERLLSTIKSHARLAQSVERETLTSTRSQGCGFDPRIGLFLYSIASVSEAFSFCHLK